MSGDTIFVPKMKGMAVLLLLTLPTGVRVGAEARPTLTVRLYNSSGVPRQELQAARRALERTFEDTGLDLVFRQCGRSASAGDPVDSCSERLKALEVVVRVIDSPALNPTLHPEACGVAYLVRETDRGWLATVFSNRIATVATRTGVDAGTLLGLVTAHEIGHLLLGAGYHGWTGVMQADWPDAQIQDDRWQFSRVEAARMRDAARF